MESRQESNGWVLRFEPGERLRPTLEHFLAENECTSGQIMAIGAALNPEIAYFSRKKRRHFPRKIRGFYEILSLVGNVSLFEGGMPGFHLHGCFGGRFFRVRGGHVHDLTVYPTLEMFISQADRPLRRKTDPSTGVQLLDLSRT